MLVLNLDEDNPIYINGPCKITLQRRYTGTHLNLRVGFECKDIVKVIRIPLLNVKQQAEMIASIRD